VDITLVIPTIPPRAALLARALASMDAQSYPPAEVITLVDLQREGAAATRNRALDLVTTDWVAFLDDDDELYPDHLRRLARFARITGADLVYPYFDADVDELNTFGLPFDPVLLRQANYIPVTVLARTQALKDAGGFQAHPDRNGDPCEDWGLWLALLDAGATLAHLPARTWRWHNGGEGSTRGKPDRW
jgi:glycosyltransferase involved in cell wall biosynthesis